jgi:hypothetical protein
MANGREMAMAESRKTLDGLPKNAEATMMSEPFPSSHAFFRRRQMVHQRRGNFCNASVDQQP